MTKKHLLLSFMVLLGLSANANPVSKSQAKNAAISFLQRHNPSATLQAEPKQAPRKVNGKASSDAAYYVFNTTNNNGYVIVSGDDRTAEILGYVDKGTYDEAKIPENMKAWLNSYAEQLGLLGKMNDSEAGKQLAARKTPKSTRNSISPLITTNWDQATPYWNKCPQFVDENGQNPEYSYTGCVATAMAQIMKFHNWPAKASQTIPSYTFTYSSGSGLGTTEYGTATTEALEPVEFDWANMRDNYTGAEDEASTNAVATLMQYAGYAVKMQYGVSSSATYTDEIPGGFTRYFDYNKDSCRIAFRNDYNEDSWNDLIYSELAKGRPMIYNGTAGSGGGHSFVCDGYEYGDYFHINWGWGGMGNGFFLLEILNPHESGIGGAGVGEGYNTKMNAIVGIIPGNGSAEADPDQPVTPDTKKDILTVTNVACNSSSTTMSFDRDSKSDGFTIYKRKTFDVTFSDHNSTGKKYKEGIALYDSEGNFVKVIMTTTVAQTVTVAASGTRYRFGESISDSRNGVKFGQGLTGDYKIIPVSQVEGSEDWVPMLESDRFYFAVNMTSDEATITCHPMVDLKATKYEFSGGEKVGKPEQVKVTLHNNSADRFFGYLYLHVAGEQLDEYSQYTTSIQAEVPANGDKVVTFNFTPTTAGTKGVGISTDDMGYNNIPGQSSVTIAETSSDDMNLSVVIKAENADENNVIYDSHAVFSARITNNSTAEYNKYVLAPLFIVSKNAQGEVLGGEMVTYKQSNLSVAPGASETLYFEFDNLAYGSTYSMNIYARNNVPDSEEGTHLENIVKKGESVYYDIKNGIITWNAQGVRKGVKPENGYQIPADAVAVNLEGADITSIKTNDNPNTLYFFGENETALSGLEGNIVIGNKASDIKLVDGNDFYTPFSFTADNISYERTVDATLNANRSEGWNTITLPFAASTVTVDGSSTEWTKNADAVKPLFICDFDKEDGKKVEFNFVESLEANRPYIIGAEQSLANKKLVFSATNAKIIPGAVAYTSGTNYLFAGTLAQTTVSDLFKLNAVGSQFSPSSEIVPAFRAYFQALTSNVDDNIVITIPEIATSINEIDHSAINNQNATLYNLAGQKVNKNYKGIVIKNGRKYIAK